MIKTCDNCNNEFEAKRGTARYCSERCKKVAQRVSGTNTVSVTGENRVSGTNIPLKPVSGTKTAERVSGTKNEGAEIINKTKVSVPKSQLSPLAGDLKVPASFDDKYSPDYDLSEEGFIRRNKNWMDFSERSRENRRRDARKIKENIALELAVLQRMRKGGWNNPLTNTALAPKGIK